MTDVSQLLPKLLTASAANNELLETVVKLAWTKVAGAGIRQQVAPFRLFRRTLIVAVTDAIWQKQLHQMSREFVTRINRLLGAEIINSIEFRIDPETVKDERKIPSAAETASTPQKLPSDVIDAANAIRDSDLRQRFIRAAANCVTRRDSVRARQ
jgi:hypothetical protein